MATKAQIHANRTNAEKSTGPRTDEGKTKVAQNAVKHGLLAQRNVIIGEDPEEFDLHRDQMLGELAPAGVVETLLVERIVSLSWRLRRAERAQNEAFDEFHATMIASPIAKLVQRLTPKPAGAPLTDEEHLALGRVVTRDFSNSRVVDRLLMYERRIENSLYKTIAELHKLRLMHERAPATEKPTPESDSVGGNDPSRQTNPMGEERPACRRYGTTGSRRYGR